ncbi:MAG TPA: hypothetical protein VK665_12775 [Candidatus Elarobacter sp.]|nr:hypothetical protein [Candidatus Elarobacter sp.]
MEVPAGVPPPAGESPLDKQVWPVGSSLACTLSHEGCAEATFALSMARPYAAVRFDDPAVGTSTARFELITIARIDETSPPAGPSPVGVETALWCNVQVDRHSYVKRRLDLLWFAANS